MNTKELMDWIWEQRESTANHNAIQAFDAVWKRLQATLPKAGEE